MYVYLLKSEINQNQHYIGLTQNSERRLQEHNQGKSIHTNKYKPWKIVAYIWFEDANKAEEFEKYLKHGSGHAFAKRHFW
jgi:putative endonuclease